MWPLSLWTISESFSNARSGKDKRMFYIEQFSTPILDEDFLEEVQMGRRNMKQLIKKCDMTDEWFVS